MPRSWQPLQTQDIEINTCIENIRNTKRRAGMEPKYTIMTGTWVEANPATRHQFVVSRFTASRKSGDGRRGIVSKVRS